MFDQELKLIVSNRTYEEIFGLEHGEVVPGMAWDDVQALENGAVDPPEYHSFSPDFEKIERSSVNIRLADGRTILRTRRPFVGGGWVSIFEDITERQQARDKLVYMSRHDALTGLPNRVALREYLAKHVTPHGEGVAAFAVFCLDLDEFKTINDTFGHPAGDKLLCSVAGRLLASNQPGELVARLGGDEFAVVTALNAEPEALARRCEALIAAIGEPHQLEDHEAMVGVSIGVTMADTVGADADTLLMQADLALYRAKFEGRNTYRFFESGMETAVRVRHDLITDLRSAIDNRELTAVFQPQVNLATHSITGFEALMRWRNPRRGNIPPLEFIPLAEETGLIVAMGEWMLREATTVAAQWPGSTKLAVNISARQLQRPGFVLTVTSALGASGLEPHRLELEVTESVLLQNDDITAENSHAPQGAWRQDRA